MKKLKILFAALAALSLVLLVFPLCAFAEEADAPTEDTAGGNFKRSDSGSSGASWLPSTYRVA